MTRFFVDAQGAYIGGFDGAAPPAGAIEVPSAPAIATQTWNGSAWSAPQLTAVVLKSTVMGRLTPAQMASAYTMLTQNPVNFGKWFAPDKPYVNCDDADAIAVVKALGLDPTVILAP